MYIVYILVIIILIYFYTRPCRVYIDEEGYVQKGVLSHEECQRFIEIAEEFQFETKLDGVDNQPEYQIDILDDIVKNEKLWKMCKKVYETKMPRITR